MNTFRVRAKHLFLSYELDNCTFDDEKLKSILTESLDFFTTKVKFSLYYFGVIKKDSHITLHYYLGFDFVQDFSDPLFFDLSLNCLENLVLRGTYKGCNFFSKYVKNLHNESVMHITNISSYNTDLKDLKTPTLLEKLLEIANQEGFSAAKEYYLTKHPIHFMQQGGDKILSRLKILVDYSSFSEGIKNVYPLHFFVIPDKVWVELNNWCESSYNKSIIIEGSPGTGKTCFIKSFLDHKQIPFFYSRSFNDLKNLTDKHEAIVFDDVNFEKKKQLAEYINIFEAENASSVRILYAQVIIPFDVKKF